MAMGRATVTLPKITAKGRAPVAPAPRPPAEITHPPVVYHATGDRPEPTDALPSNAMENSGSLTGHVLSRGHLDIPGPRSRGVVVVLVIAAIVATLALFGLIIAAATSEAVSGFFERVTA